MVKDRERNIIIVASENMSSNVILNSFFDHHKSVNIEIILIPNITINNRRNKNRLAKLLFKSSFSFIFFKLAEIYIDSIIRYFRRDLIWQKCKKFNIRYKKFEGINFELMSYILRIRPDFIVNLSPNIYPKIFFENLEGIEILNCHCAELPYYKGLANYFWMLLNKEQTAKITLHKLIGKIDEGDIVKTFDVDISLIKSCYLTNFKISLFAGKFLSNFIYDETNVVPFKSYPHSGGLNRGVPTRSSVSLLRKKGLYLFKFAEVLRIACNDPV